MQLSSDIQKTRNNQSEDLHNDEKMKLLNIWTNMEKGASKNEMEVVASNVKNIKQHGQ